NHSGGTNTVDGVTDIFVLGSTGPATYNLSGTGALIGGNGEVIGSGANATFNQTGGSNATSDMLLGTAPVGTYTLSGGTASLSGTLAVGGFTSFAGGTGILTVSGTASLTTQTLKIYDTPGTIVNFSGGTLAATALNFDGVGRFNWTGGTL